MRVSLTRAGLADCPTPLLSPRGAGVILGGSVGELAAPIVPSAQTLFGPRGVCLAGPDGPLAVCDTGHHRLLIWRRLPGVDNLPAEIVIGQHNFFTEGRNAKGEVGPATLNVPTGVAFGDGVLAVADAWNHRVLLWHHIPERSNQPADVVLGQANMTSSQANRGADAPTADTLNWCYGVAIQNGRLFVADTGNRRVLVWHRIPWASGAPADLVLGQDDFSRRDESAGRAVGAVGMRWPHAIAVDDRRLFVADAGSSRVMVWNGFPKQNGAPCDLAFGQTDLYGNDHNRSAANPTAATLNMPYGLTLARNRLVVADTANSRLVSFDRDAPVTGEAASALTGQASFSDKGDNRWNLPARDSLCWPYAIVACDNRFVIADSGNNRVLLWDAA